MVQDGLIMERTNHICNISPYHKLNLKYLLKLPKPLPMSDDSISHILFKILEEYKTVLPEPEPKEVWKEREWNKPLPISKRNDIFAC